MSIADQLDNFRNSLECDLTLDVKMKIERAIGQLLMMIQEKHIRDQMELQKELFEKCEIEKKKHLEELLKMNENIHRDMTERNKMLWERSAKKQEELLEKSRIEKLDLVKENASRMSKLHRDLLFMKQQLQSQIGENLQARNKCNVRGALEFVMAQANIKTLDKLENKPGFSQKLENVCKNNKFRFEDVSHCLSDLYHKASKDYYHGDISVIISKNPWEADEILALGLIFDEFHIPFIFYNEEGLLNKYPYELPSSCLQYFC